MRRNAAILRALACVLGAFPGTHAAAQASPFTHRGETIRAMVFRGEDSLPAYRVPVFQAGDRIEFSAAPLQGSNLDPTWIGGILQVPESYARITPPRRGEEIGWWGDAGSPPPLRRFSTVMRAGHRPILFVAPARSSRNPGPTYEYINRTLQRQSRELVDLNRELQLQVTRSTLLAGMQNVLRTDSANVPDTFRERLELLSGATGTTVAPACFNHTAEGARFACLLTSLGDGSKLPSGTDIGRAMLGMATQQDRAMTGELSLYLQAALQIGQWVGRLNHPGNYEIVPAVAAPAERDGEPFPLMLLKQKGLRSGGDQTASVQLLTLGAPERGRRPPPLPVHQRHPTCVAGERITLPVGLDPSLVGNHYGFGWEVVPAARRGAFRIPAEAVEGSLTFMVRGRAVPRDLPPGPHSVRLRGHWGFETLESEPFTIEVPDPETRLAPGEAAKISAGSATTVRIQSRSPRCVTRVAIQHGQFSRDTVGAQEMFLEGADIITRWRFPEQSANPEAQLVIQQGEGEPLRIPVPILDRDPVVQLSVHATDDELSVVGERQALVQGVTHAARSFGGPQDDETNGRRVLTLEAGQPYDPSLVGRSFPVEVHLAGGRRMRGTLTVLPVRPYVRVQDTRVARNEEVFALPPQALADRDAMELSLVPDRDSYAFSAATTKVQVRFADDPQTVKDVTNAQIIPRQIDLRIVPADLFGRRVAGPLQFRVTEGAGRETAWTDLSYLVVRTPAISAIRRDAGTGTWRMEGASLNVITGVAQAPDGPRTHQGCTQGSTSTCLIVPEPVEGTLYVWFQELAVSPTRVRVPQPAPPPASAPPP